MSNEVISQFVEVLARSVITLAVPLIVAVVYAFFKAKVEEVKSNLPNEVLYTIEAIARLVVEAAEQSGLTDELLREGVAKKAWAMEYGERLLREQLGLFLDLEKLGDDFWKAIREGLDAAVEAKVYRLGAKPPEQ